MLKYKHILLATDFSAASQSIVQTASNLQQRCKADLSIVYVLEYTTAVYGGGEFSIPLDAELQQKLAEHAEMALTTLGKQLHVPKNKQFIAHGSIKNAVVNLAIQQQIDLIVIGRHGHHGLDKLLGSTANAILHAAKCDVLAVNIRRE